MLPKVLLLLSVGWVAYVTGFGDDIEKCSILDAECQTKKFETALQAVAATGVPELDIPVLDPYMITDTSVNVFGLMDMTMVDGVVEGIKDMKFENYETNIEKGYTILDAYYDVITIKGHYRAHSTPITQKVLGNNVTADGVGKMVMEKVKLNFKFAFHPELREDGEIYLIPDRDLSKYKFDVVGGMKFEANNIKFGITDISLLVTNFMNQNWDYVASTFSKPFTDKAAALHYDYSMRFFTTVPARKYLTDDLTPYLKCNN